MNKFKLDFLKVSRFLKVSIFKLNTEVKPLDILLVEFTVQKGTGTLISNVNSLLKENNKEITDP